MIKLKIKLVLIFLIFLFLPFSVWADYLGQKTNFFIEATYDTLQREQISATLRRISPSLYFYFDDALWNSLNYDKKNKIEKAINDLADEFDNNIYPTLTSFFGSE